MTEKFSLAGVEIRPGHRRKVDIPIAKLYDFTGMSIPVEVVRGMEDGPTLFICGAIHGDEINGVEIVKRVLNHASLSRIKGTLIAVPIVNVFGFNTKNRYLPDRRDLNRCFPGNAEGSMASQLAYVFMQEVVSKATHGIDLHTGAIHRDNLPHIRAALEDPETLALAEAFNVPVIMNSASRDGSLRDAATRAGDIKVLLFEGGEALRFNEPTIRLGLQGILSVMQSIGMLPTTKPKGKKFQPFIARSSHWVRAPHSGTLIARKGVGDKVRKNEILGVISDPFGEHRFTVHASHEGIIIGQTMLPLVNEGNACFHIACHRDSKQSLEATPPQELVSAQLETFVT
jgi:uncharacterized protein